MKNAVIAACIAALVAASGAYAAVKHSPSAYALEAPVASVPAGSTATLEAICPSHRAVSGGGTGAEIVATMPVTDGAGTVIGWSVSFKNLSGSLEHARAVAVCSS